MYSDNDKILVRSLNMCNVEYLKGFSGGSMIRILPANAGDTGGANLIPGLGRSPEGENGNPLSYSCLKSSRDRGTWLATVQFSSVTQ